MALLYLLFKMASKIVVFFLIVTICKVQPQAVGYQNCGSPNVRAQQPGSNKQSAGNIQPRQTQITLPAQSNGNSGITACPKLQIVPGQGNIQAIPISQLTGIVQQKGQTQNCGCNAARSGIQGNPCPQVQLSPVQVSSPSLGIQPSCGSSSVITAPVSAITIPGCNTILVDSLSNTLANALQMLIASDFINSAVCNNIINQDGNQIPVAETVVPCVDLTTLLQGLNAQQCGQTCQGSSQGSCQKSCQGQNYDWTTIQNYLNQQNEQICPVVSQPQQECACPDVAALVNYLSQNGRTIDQINNQQNQCCQQTYGGDFSSNGVLEALAAYLGCSTSEVSSNGYPYAAEIQFPAEIPAQLVCNYGYMPTTVPVCSFSVQPITNEGDGYIACSQY